MNPTSTPTAPAAADLEVRLTALLVTGALLLGAVLQVFVPPGALTLVAASALAGLVVLVLAFVVPGRLRTTIAGFRFTSTLLIVLAVFAVLGTLIMQGKPAAYYHQRYSSVAGLILALRFDDIFHGLPFAGLMALFGAAVISSASLRWPVKARNSGFFLCHLGLITSLAGAATSAALSIRGRIDLHAGGETATQVRVTKAGMDTGGAAPLGFDLHLDKFDLVNYETEYRVAYYEQVPVKEDGVLRAQWRLKASFDPDQAQHRLPGGDSFRLKAIYPDFAPQAKAVPVAEGGAPALQVTLEKRSGWLSPGEALDTGDRRAVVAFSWDKPAAPPGYLTAFLVWGAEKQVIVHTADGETTVPLTDGLALAGGTVKLGQLLPQARRSFEPATASQEWKRPAVTMEVHQAGAAKEQLMLADRPQGFFLAPTRALVFEKRDKEVKAFLSHVTATQGSKVEQATVAVNEPMTFGGWTLYQVNYNPEDPTYSGIEAVYDPGVKWVFLGFFLISLGVFTMFYVEPRLKAAASRKPVPAAPAQAA